MTTTLAPDTPVRRVVLKTSGAGSSGPPCPAGATRDRPAGHGPRPDLQPGPAIYIHCAAETGNRDAALAGLAQRRDEELAAVDAETNDSLGSLRNRLLLISSLTFVAAALGSFWLVRLGLSPLRRLSDAVSRVSAKDFRLPVDERRLPLRTASRSPAR